MGFHDERQRFTWNFPRPEEGPRSRDKRWRVGWTFHVKRPRYAQALHRDYTAC